MSARSFFLPVGLLLGFAASAAPPSLDDYARGVVVEGTYGQPILEMTLPDAVYLGATRSDLGDVRVFNAEGVPVPHALCSAPTMTAPDVSEQSLPVYELRDARRVADGGSQIELRTSAGTQITVQEGSEGETEMQNGRTHIIDAREIGDRLRAITFDWSSPDGASEARVRIEASDDLDQWRVLVPGSSLLRAASGDQQIKRERITLPERQYFYLRVQRVDGGPPLQINSAVAEQVLPTSELEPMWFGPRALQSSDSGTLLFDSDRVAPVQFARVQVMQENSSVRVRLQSRANDKAPWTDRWSGESYLVVTQTERRENPVARFAATTDRQWRVQLEPGSQLQVPPMVQLGYRPMRLRFLAQGATPYTIAFGSRRAEMPSPARCDSLLSDVSPQDLSTMIAEAYPSGVAKVLGGDTALKPLPQPTPLRLIILWGVLVTGVILLIAMALALLKRVRPTGS